MEADTVSVSVPSAWCGIFNVFENSHIPPDVILSLAVMLSLYVVPLIVQYTVPDPYVVYPVLVL